MKLVILSFVAGCFCCVGVGQEVPPVPMPANPVDNIVIEVDTLLENEDCCRCRRTPVRNLVSGALAVPGKVADRWQEVQPVRSIARRTRCFTKRVVCRTRSFTKRVVGGTLRWTRGVTRRVLYY